MGGVEIQKKKVVQRLGVLDMVVEKCSFYDVFLKVVFKKHVNYNEQITFRNVRKRETEDPINRLRALLLREVRMRIQMYLYVPGCPPLPWDGHGPHPLWGWVCLGGGSKMRSYVSTAPARADRGSTCTNLTTRSSKHLANA